MQKRMKYVRKLTPLTYLAILPRVFTAKESLKIFKQEYKVSGTTILKYRNCTHKLLEKQEITAILESSVSFSNNSQRTFSSFKKD
jgi:hypothetical protein